MIKLSEGDKAPEITVKVEDGSKIDLGEFYQKGHLVLYFYPKDFTPGCTQEAKDFNEQLDDFTKYGCKVLGVSKDSVDSHKKFIAKHNLGFSLVVDDHQELCQAFGVWQEKKMFNKVYMGIVRYTFLIKKNGVVKKIWKKVRVKGHVQQVLEELKTL